MWPCSSGNSTSCARRMTWLGMCVAIGRTGGSVGGAPAISGDLLSAVISTRYILVFRKDNPNVFNSLIQNWPRFQRHKIHMLLILLALCLRKPNGISHLLSMAYAIAGNG